MPLPHSKTTNINSLKAHSMTQFRRTSKVVVVISKGQKKNQFWDWRTAKEEEETARAWSRQAK